MFRFFNKWFSVLWQPLLIGLLFGLLVSNLVILNATKNQSAERDEDLRKAEAIQALIIRNINANTNKNTKEIIKLQRLTACLLVAHDVSLPVQDDIRMKCVEDIEAGFSPPPENQNDKAPSKSPQHVSPGGSPPNGGGDTPLLLPEGQGLVRDSVPILGNL